MEIIRELLNLGWWK